MHSCECPHDINVVTCPHQHGPHMWTTLHMNMSAKTQWSLNWAVSKASIKLWLSIHHLLIVSAIYSCCQLSFQKIHIHIYIYIHILCYWSLKVSLYKKILNQGAGSHTHTHYISTFHFNPCFWKVKLGTDSRGQSLWPCLASSHVYCCLTALPPWWLS